MPDPLRYERMSGRLPIFGHGERQRDVVLCEQGVGDNGPLRCNVGHAMGFAQMGDERERPVTGGHRIDVPVGFQVDRQRENDSLE